MRVLYCVILFFFVFETARVVAQTKPANDKDEVIRIDTELVEVPLTVVDKAGRPVANLSKNNFVVFEDGKPQKIEEFSAVNAPFEVALLLDTSGSARADLDLIRRAAQNFIDSLRPGDRVSILAFKSNVIGNRTTSGTDLVVKLTSDRAALRDAIQRVQTSNSTPYYDGLLEIADVVFAGPAADEFRGRRAVVALTDGVDSSSAAGFGEARDKLAAKGITSYFINVDTRSFFEENLLGDCQSAIRFSRAQIDRYYASFSRNSKVEKTSDFCRLGDFERLAISKALYELADTEMNELARVSGGRVFPVGDLAQARVAFKEVADEIGTRYSLGYYPANEKKDGKFRTIKVELKGLPAGASVRAREGYTAPSN